MASKREPLAGFPAVGGTLRTDLRACGDGSAPAFHAPLRFAARWLFTAYHDIRVKGAENVPAEGPVIIASNHPTYLDAAFLMVGLRRSVRFMAWEKHYRVPLLGALMRAYGVIPVDIRKPGRASFEAAVRVLRGGEAFGIFPEGGRTKSLAPMNPFKSGVARLALITGAPIVPATITGGLRVWRRGDWLPKPGRIEVVFHPPLRVPPESRTLWRRDKTLEHALIERIIDTIHRSLLPYLRKERRLRRLLEGPPQPPHLFVEGLPFFFLALGFFELPPALRAERAASVASWLSAYGLALVAELALEARGAWAKVLRQTLPWVLLGGLLWQEGLRAHAWAAAGAAAALLILWLQILRFSLYRRLRTPMLAIGYSLWLYMLLR
ncbi:MAG: lysophospholipid acyltransferase family protein [Elusimicrobiota bacterium]